MVDWLSGFLCNILTIWLVIWLACSPILHTVWLKNWLASVQRTLWLTDQLADLQTDFAVHTVRLTDQLTDWLTFCLTYTLSDWLAMLADCLCYFLPGKFLGLNYSLLEILPKNAFRSKWSCVSGQYQTTKQSVFFFSKSVFRSSRKKIVFLPSLLSLALRFQPPDFQTFVWLLTRTLKRQNTDCFAV